MMKKILFSFSTLALSSAFAASSYHVTLFDQSTVAGKTLKPGDYKIQLKDNSVVLMHNKEVTEASAKTEDGNTKYDQTTVRYNDKHEITEIRLGGTTKKLVFDGTGTTNSNGM